jgi:glycosyltransferase involved in cell wall biosynthesis
MITLQIIFWFCLSLIVYTYLLFPAILTMLSRNKQDPDPPFPPSQWPSVSVLIAAFNEEKVIGEKIRSLLKGQYPLELLEILVGSDASTDQTNRILQDLQQKHPALHLILFAERQGKPGIINQLAEKARGEILVITDANVILQPDTLTQLISAFMEKRIGLVDSRLVNPGVNGDGISRQEKFYISRGGKYQASRERAVGIHDGTFRRMLRRQESPSTRPVPDTFLVDDFFINMSVLKQGFYCISNVEAIVHEDAVHRPEARNSAEKRESQQGTSRTWSEL